MQSSMRALLVVVLHVGPQNPVQMPGAEDQQPVQYLYPTPSQSMVVRLEKCW